MLKNFLKIKKFLGRTGSGNFGALLHGSGLDLAENRAYAQGDEKRSINRKMSAKFDTLFINLFHAEKTIDVHLLCDVNYNRRGTTTENFLGFFAGLTTYFAREKAHLLGSVGGELLPSLEKIAYQKKFLEELETKIAKTLPVYTSSLLTMLKRELSFPKKRMIVVVSDFLDYDDETKRVLSLLRDRHEVRLVQMRDQKMGKIMGTIQLDLF